MPTVFVSTWTFGEECVREAWRHWERHNDLLGAVEAGLAAVERNPEVTSVGYGGMPNSEGVVELDAGIMEGARLEGGAVGALRGIIPAISVARRVMEDTPHLLLAGDCAVRFAIRNGFQPTQLLTHTGVDRYAQWLAEKTKPMTEHDTKDTCTCVGVREDGHTVVGCTTSGLAWKLPGRVGDSPILGAGVYADDEVGGAGATGVGEEIWRFCLSYQAVENMRRGLEPIDACRDAIGRMVRRKPETKQRCTAVFAVRKDGVWGAAASKDGFTAQVCSDGEFAAHPIRGIES